MRRLCVCILTTLFFSTAVHAETLPVGTEIETSDKFPAAILPFTPGSPNECYIEAGGTVRVVGREQIFSERRVSIGPSALYVPVLFTPPSIRTRDTHGLMCQRPTQLWVLKSKLLDMQATQRAKAERRWK